MANLLRDLTVLFARGLVTDQGKKEVDKLLTDKSLPPTEFKRLLMEIVDSHRNPIRSNRSPGTTGDAHMTSVSSDGGGDS